MNDKMQILPATTTKKYWSLPEKNVFDNVNMFYGNYLLIQQSESSKNSIEIVKEI